MITNDTERAHTEALVAQFKRALDYLHPCCVRGGGSGAGPPFNDPIARQALAYGIDQQQMANSVFQGIFPGPWGMFEETSPYYISRKDAGYPEHDIEKAKEFVKQHERSHNGEPLEFSTLVPADPQYLATAQTFQAQVAEFGTKVNVEAIEQTQLISRLIAADDYQASWFIRWSSPALDCSYTFLAIKPVTNGLSLNFSRVEEPAITQALDRFRSTVSQLERFDAGPAPPMRPT
ncbi:MAG: hypothetical protein HYX32_12785 [Actinobacteria bacterium]|nr:hypothetical protein [Actinomycetota bacterium]